MPLYVTVSEGPRADRSAPILAVSDTRIIGALLDAIQRLADESQAAAVVRLLPSSDAALRPIESEGADG